MIKKKCGYQVKFYNMKKGVWEFKPCREKLYKKEIRTHGKNSSPKRLYKCVEHGVRS